MSERLQRLRKKASELPLSPGVYIMLGREGEVVYVGKSSALKNRVSQYFQNTSKGRKTDRMVEAVYDFDYILCDTEAEALALENSKIKQYSPKYNIKLKDDKNYPYIKITKGEYPSVVLTRKRVSDGGRYFGPYSSATVARSIYRTVQKTMLLPNCKRSFPRDIGKGRPCVYSQIGRCAAPCSGKLSAEEYGKLIKGAQSILRGDIAEAKQELQRDMEKASEALDFELAAVYRDRIYALEALYDKQKVVSSPDLYADVIGMYEDGDISVISVFIIRRGTVTDTLSYEFSGDKIVTAENIPAFIASVYEMRSAPEAILLQMDISDEDMSALSDMLVSETGKRVKIKVPKRGIYRDLCRMVGENAEHRARLAKEEQEKSSELLIALAKALALEVVPDRIEAFDISNFGDDEITAGMIVLENAAFKKKDYRVFKMKQVKGADDYASMREALGRRIDNTLVKQSASYPVLPDLILLDGGRTHVAAVKDVLFERGCDTPVFGMVKDEHHKTRALCTDTEIIDISRDRQLFGFIYRIQEEVHRFAISRMSKGRSKKLKRSSLENIEGIGPAKAKLLLKHFGSLSALSSASEEELTEVKGVNEALAQNIVRYFSKNNDR